MPGRRFETGRDALDFISQLSALTNAESVVGALRDKLASFGYHAFLITGLPDTGDRIDPLVLINGWPSGWFDLYVARSFADHDPIAAHCKQSIDPFAWSDIYRDELATKYQREVMQRARDFSMVHGFCVPIHNQDGFQAVVTMAGDRPDLTREARAAINLMSIYAHSKAKACSAAPSLARRLTTREREVLTWFALGRNTQAVAERLGISGETVEAHYRSAARKLSVRGRTHTVVEAMRRQEITL
ncbi:LuxR family transcriptional regulator [Bosea sp. TND4EK4]|uniref:LuxR family transcriptional regulator n=1 Tax=Bosea sp. TND4EK4 TaxID=1907408 RepID=UPI0009555515|nr:LuxR family transcriptional regulator [Bosea sp. TND4EK4]SIQ75650.1 LuxR family transcriptional regulator, quorum sensing-dependent transcriptional regulator [Bosea sp. TND4EK4]